MWTLVCIALIFAVGSVLILMFFAGAKRLDSPKWNAIERGDWHKPDWDGLHREEE